MKTSQSPKSEGAGRTRRMTFSGGSQSSSRIYSKWDRLRTNPATENKKRDSDGTIYTLSRGGKKNQLKGNMATKKHYLGLVRGGNTVQNSEIEKNPLRS